VERAEAAAAAARRELEALTHSVSHDLRAPLRGIQGFTHLVLEECSDTLPENARHYLQRVSLATRRLSGLIDDLLELSRIGRADLQRRSVDLTELARATWRETESKDPARQVPLTVAEGMTVEADVRLLRIALEQLLGNAWKFTGRTSGARVEVGRRDVGGEPAFFVQDNGAGFNQAHASRLFAPFQRLHAEADFPGTGIGLAIVQRVIRRHGGSVWAEGTPGSGATVYFTMPPDIR
jgi:signal transduction histidine kinase